MNLSVNIQDRRVMEQLVKAIEQANIQKIRHILNHPNAKQIVNQVDIDVYNSLFHASKIPNEDTSLQVINMLLDKGANPYHKEENKQTILFYLAKQGKAKIIEKLLQTYKYDLNDIDNYNQNPLYWAAKFGRLKVAQLLVRHGVNINHLDNNGQTCLFYACAQGHLQMCKFLINRGCQHDLVDKLKKTPLMFAKQHKRTAVAEYLMSLKQQNKKVKEKEKDKQREKQRQKSKDIQKSEERKKKKDVIRNEYVFAFTNEDGQVHQMTPQEIQQFKNMSDYNLKIYEYMHKPDLLQNVQAKHQKKFIRICNKIITSYLKRNDLFIFHAAVDTTKYTNYLDYIERPMDFSLIKTKLQFNCYENEEEFKSDIFLVYDNCIRFNGLQSPLGQIANQLKAEFVETYRKESLNI